MNTAKNYRVKLAFGFYSVGQIIQPTGLWRGELLARGFIEPIEGTSAAQEQAAAVGTQAEVKPKRKRRHELDGMRNERQPHFAGASL